MKPVGCVTNYPWLFFKKFGNYAVTVQLPHIEQPCRNERVLHTLLSITHRPEMFGNTKTVVFAHGAINVIKRSKVFPSFGAWSSLRIKERELFSVGHRTK